MAKTSAKQLESIARYQKANIKQYKLALNRKTDADIINYLDCLANKQAVIKAIIREHISQQEGA